MTETVGSGKSYPQLQVRKCWWVLASGLMEDFGQIRCIQPFFSAYGIFNRVLPQLPSQFPASNAFAMRIRRDDCRWRKMCDAIDQNTDNSFSSQQSWNQCGKMLHGQTREEADTKSVKKTDGIPLNGICLVILRIEFFFSWVLHEKNADRNINTFDIFNWLTDNNNSERKYRLN